MQTTKKLNSVDDYIAAAAPAARPLLQTLRKTIKQAAPEAKEKLSYGMPYYSFHGRFMYFGAFKDHVSLYPMKSGVTNFQKKLIGYKTSAGTVQFPLDKPLPVDLIRQIVEFRVQENLDKIKR